VLNEKKPSLTSNQIAWEFLLPNFPMVRRVDTLEVFSARRGLRLMQLDVRLPDRCKSDSTVPGETPPCFIPAAFLSKYPVVPDLEVQDGAGEIVSVPTRGQNMDLTAQAFAQISADAAGVLGGPSKRYRLDEPSCVLIDDVIRMPPREARVCSLEIAELVKKPRKRDWLLPLLARLEDHYVLWVPIESSAAGEHRLSIRRSAMRRPNPVFPQLRGKPEKFTVETSSGDELEGTWHPARKWARTFDPAAAVGRGLVAFGLMPVKFEEDALEADRFSSYHTCIVPPAGLLLREVRAGEVFEDPWEAHKLEIHEFKTDEDRDQTVQGEDTHRGHIHLAKARNPAWLNSRVTIGLRPGTTTLWALVAVLTCLLLWALHHNIREFPLHAGSDRCAARALVSTKGHCRRRADVASGTNRVSQVRPAAREKKDNPHDGRLNLAIAVAVLLVGPTFASAWALRDKDRALMRSMLAGTRLLLLGSAILSVSAALALAGVRPFNWGVGEAIGWYASLSYTIAVVMVIGWLQARGPIWLIYRRALTATKWNLLTTIGLALVSGVAIIKLSNFPPYCQALLFLAGFGFTAIAGNRASSPLGEVSRLPAALAGFGGILTLALASREFGFYNHLIARGTAHMYGRDAEFALAVAAFALLAIRYSIRLYRWRRIKELQKRREDRAKSPVPAGTLESFT
jgi:hypothetical protein